MEIDERVADTLHRLIDGSPEHEICGYLTLDGSMQQHFHQLVNRAVEPDNFWISRIDYIRFKRKCVRNNLKILALVHSHRDGLELSREDKASLNSGELPWIVVTLADGRLRYSVYDPHTKGGVSP